VLRRVAGQRTLLNGGVVPLVTLLLQVYDRDRRRFFSLPLDTAFPVGLDLAIGPEKTYPAGGGITFDLPSGIDPIVHLAPVEAGSFRYGQIVFQGARRFPGERTRPTYFYREVPYTYRLPFAINWNVGAWAGGVLTSVAAPQPIYLAVNDYEFELLSMNLFNQATGLYPAAVVGGPVAAMTLYNAAGRAVSNAPILADYLFANALATTGYYSQGLSPTMVYPPGGQIKVDVSSLLAAADLGPPAPQYEIEFNGVRRVPV
jgi:hypothetical protein